MKDLRFLSPIHWLNSMVLCQELFLFWFQQADEIQSNRENEWGNQVALQVGERLLFNIIVRVLDTIKQLNIMKQPSISTMVLVIARRPLLSTMLLILSLLSRLCTAFSKVSIKVLWAPVVNVTWRCHPSHISRRFLLPFWNVLKECKRGSLNWGKRFDLILKLSFLSTVAAWSV